MVKNIALQIKGQNMSDYKLSNGHSLTYQIVENGYYILIDGNKYLYQYEPYIPDHNLSYEENAIKQIQEIIANEKAMAEETDTFEKQLSELKDTVSTNSGGVDELGSVVSDIASALDDLAYTVSALTENNNTK